MYLKKFKIEKKFKKMLIFYKRRLPKSTKGVLRRNLTSYDVFGTILNWSVKRIYVPLAYLLFIFFETFQKYTE